MIKRKLYSIFENPIIIILGILVFTPNPLNEKIGLLSRITLIIGYTTLYLSENNSSFSIGNFFDELKDFYYQYKGEFILISVYLLYECIILIFQPISFSTISYTFRFIYFVLIFLTSVKAKKRAGFNLNKILRFIYYMTIIQSFVMILQLFDINFLSFLYNDEKSFPLGWLVRLTGLYSNPNTFAWFSSFYALLILLLENNKVKKFIFIIFSIIALILSGSRTMMVIGPLMWMFGLTLNELVIYNNYKFLKTSILTTFIGSIILLSILYLLRNQLPYAAQLLNIFEGGLNEVVSFNLRMQNWNKYIVEITADYKKMFIGFRTANSVFMDNDILYIIYRSGIFGLIAQYTLYIFMLVKLMITEKKTTLNIIVFTLLIFSILIGFQADTVSGWTYMPSILLLYGLCSNMSNSNLDKELYFKKR